MASESRTRNAPCLLMMSVVLSGCASSSIRSDHEHIRGLTGISVAPTADDIVSSADERDQLRALRMSEPLDAERAVRLALLNSRRLRSTLHELGVARGELLQAGLPPNPGLEIEALPERDTSLELRVEYDLAALMLAPLKADAAQAELEAKRYEAALAVVQLGTEVRTAFIQLQWAEQRFATGQRALDAFAAARDAAHALAEAGNISGVQAASEVAAYETARLGVAEMELAVFERRERLLRLLGLPPEDASWRVQAPLPPVPDELEVGGELEARALEASFELKTVKSQLDAAATRTAIAQLQGWLPELSIDVHSLYGPPGEDDARQDRLWRFGAGVSAAVPLFDRQQGTRAAREAEFDALSDRQQGRAVEIRSEVREWSARLISSHARARQLERVILPAQRRVTEEILLQYNGMQLGVFDLLRARRAELETELAYVDALAEYWATKAGLDAILEGGRPTRLRDAATPVLAGRQETGEEH